MTGFDPNSDEFGASYLDPEDEAVSAYVDGEATPEERSLIEASPELMARVAEIESVSARMTSELTMPSETQRDEMVTNALAAWADQRLEHAGMDPADARFENLDATDEVSVPTGIESSNQPPSARLAALGTQDEPARAPVPVQASSNTADVADLAAARRRRNRATAALGAVAAVVLLVIAIPLLGQLNAGGGDEVASTAAEASADAADGVDDGGDDGGDAGGGALDSLDAAGEVDEEAMEDSDSAAAMSDDAMSDDAMSDGASDADRAVATEAGAAPATTSLSQTTTTMSSASIEEDAEAADEGDDAAAGSAAAAPAPAPTGDGTGIEDLGLVTDLDELRAILEASDRATAGGTAGAATSPLASIDDFLITCGLELGEPDVVAVAELPDGTRLYVTGSFDPVDGLDDSRLIVDSTCTVVGTSP